ncbi:hypothetical protein O181_075481 [Austropuccinia psidii MF-1]|uniref:Integrase catalytic domain-containing protein n=1 Tax=Austropuccinia psidii MF-1 TaxID=1389203 RepID=A0A9Q3IA82_9BASI|nr:hypothetical protein [Austropuccinia psidii MF-1]
MNPNIKPHKNNPKTPSSRYPCHYCREVGHWSPNFPVCARANAARSKSRHQTANVAGLGIVPALESDAALLDLGATHSVVGDISLFTSLVKTNMTLSVALSESFEVDAIGKIKLNTPDGVLYCKNISGVVLSLSHLIQEGFSILFINHHFTLYKSRHTPISIEPLASSTFSHDITLQSPSDISALWHKRIGHLSIRQLNSMRKYNAASGIPDISFHDCSVAKSQHCPVKTPSCHMVTQPGDLIIVDLMGPYEISLNHKKYILMIQDAFSCVAFSIPLTEKTEAKSYFMNWIRQFLNVMSYKIKTIQTDNGTEFKNAALNDFLLKQGIIHEYLMPYEHHQNGIIEQTNWTISEMARTCLLAAQLPAFLWPWAFRHYIWIFNRCLHAGDSNTPFERLGKKKPQLEMLWVFGAKSYIYEHNFCKNFSPRVIVGYHLGVSEDSKGWLFWVPERKMIVKSASVIFDEFSYFHEKKTSGGGLNLIQVQNIFDLSMISEFNRQDESVLILTLPDDINTMIPTTYKEAITSLDKEHWGAAIREEINSMKDKDVFEAVDLKEALKEVPHQSILRTKWVFTRKPDRYKARLVAQGFRQIHGINYDETFAPTPTFSSFLIDKPVYLWPPMGMGIPKLKILKLKKALYGTKQASCCWWIHLKGILKEIGFKSNLKDLSTYTLDRGEDQAILWIHVDDGALTASSAELMDQISNQLNNCLKIKGLVGISITETNEGFKFAQPELIEKVLSLNPNNIVAKSPLPPNCQLESNFSCNAMDKPYLKRIARFSLSTDCSHWNAMNNLLAYLCNTKNLGILISKWNQSSEMN